jgi:hypothetical protein
MRPARLIDWTRSVSSRPASERTRPIGPRGSMPRSRRTDAVADQSTASCGAMRSAASVP